MRKWHKLAALCCILFAVLGALCCLAESFVERRRAEELLHVLANVQIGSAQKPALKEKLKGFNRYRSANGSSDGCSYEQFMFRNYGFALFHLAPAKDIWIQINYENDDVVAKAAHFAEAPNRGAFVMEEAGIGCPPASNDSLAPAGRKIYERGTFSEPNYMLSVRDNTSVPESRRRMDWTIDLTCMTRLGPCGDFRKILRGAFE